MSLTQLRQALKPMTREQVIGLLTDLYSARKEAKEFLDFFVNPDIDKYLDRAYKEVNKEIGRSKRSNSTMRISRVTKAIKNFSSLMPGDEHVLTLRYHVLTECFNITGKYNITPTQINGIIRLSRETIKLAHSAGYLDACFVFFDEWIPKINRIYSDSRELRRLMQEMYDEEKELISASSFIEAMDDVRRQSKRNQ